MAVKSYGMYIFDISNPRNPALLANYADAGSGMIGSMNMSSEFTESNLNAPRLLSNSPESLTAVFQLRGDYAIIAHRAYVEILDVSSPTEFESSN